VELALLEGLPEEYRAAGEGLEQIAKQGQGQALLSQSHASTVQRYYETCYGLAGDRIEKMRAAYGLGNVHQQLKEGRSAQRYFEEVLEIYRHAE
jgi:hypothetical protein